MCSIEACERQDTLVSSPLDGDELLHAVPVCAPYSVLASYKYKVKLTPGTQKKGKAAKQAIALFNASASARERELIQACEVECTKARAPHAK